jgi:subtilisin-like proprotein convertase family protein
LTATAALVLTAGLACGQVFSSSPNAPILDLQTTRDTINVAGGPTSITGVAVTVNIVHTFTGDIDMVLVFNGQTLELSTDNGGAGDNFTNTRFIDSAATSITAGVAPFSGDFRPEGTSPAWTGGPIPLNWVPNFAAFNGQDANGAWELVIYDDAGADQGTLLNWSIDFSPEISLNASSSVTGCLTSAAGGTINARVTVTPGNNPPSTGISVTVDGSALGLSSSITLFDDGLNGDGNAGDNVFGRNLTIASGYATGNYFFPYVVQDAQSRTVNGTMTVPVTAGVTTYSSGTSMPATAEVPDGEGPLFSLSGVFNANQANMYLIEICDPGNFTATTVGGTTLDTQLFLFNASGFGVAANDDAPTGTLQSRLTNLYVTGPGLYYLAVSRYNHDPVFNGCGGLIFPNSPFNVEHPPVAGAGSIVGWTGTVTASTTPYTIFLTGVCYPNSGPPCDPDFNGDGNVDQDDIACLSQVVAGDPSCSDADPDFNGDGNVDQDDIDALSQVVAGAECP